MGSYGDGSVYRDTRGIWRATITVDGKRRYFSGKTRTEALSKLRAARGARERGELTASRAPTVATWMTTYLRDIAPRRCQEQTLDGYKSANATWITPTLGDIRLDRLKADDIRRLHKAMEDAGLADTSIRNCHALLSRALKIAVREQKCPRNACEMVDPPQVRRKDEKALTQVDARKVLAAAAARDRNSARWVVALALGMRQAEVIGLRWSNVDLDAATLTVAEQLARRAGIHGCGTKVDGAWPCKKRSAKDCSTPERLPGTYRKSPKTRAGERVVPLPAPVVAALRAHRAAQLTERLAHPRWQGVEDVVFTQANGRPLADRHDRADWHALLEEAGVDPVRLHDARRTAVTILLELKADPKTVSEIVGHKTLAMTRHYQNVTQGQRDEAATLIGDALFGKPPRKKTS